ncbi:MAG: hypothetical protein AAB263_14655 [Planctomycetota bacterium]
MGQRVDMLTDYLMNSAKSSLPDFIEQQACRERPNFCARRNVFLACGYIGAMRNGDFN